MFMLLVYVGCEVLQGANHMLGAFSELGGLVRRYAAESCQIFSDMSVPVAHAYPGSCILS